MTYFRIAASWPAAWFLYGLAVLLYHALCFIDVPLEQESMAWQPRLSVFERARLFVVSLLYPVYNWIMIASSAIQDWGGGQRGPWTVVNECTISEADIADDVVPAEVERAQ